MAIRPLLLGSIRPRRIEPFSLWAPAHESSAGQTLPAYDRGWAALATEWPAFAYMTGAMGVP